MKQESQKNRLNKIFFRRTLMYSVILLLIINFKSGPHGLKQYS
jgi:hypothetical protein